MGKKDYTAPGLNGAFWADSLAKYLTKPEKQTLLEKPRRGNNTSHKLGKLSRTSASVVHSNDFKSRLAATGRTLASTSRLDMLVLCCICSQGAYGIRPREIWSCCSGALTQRFPRASCLEEKVEFFSTQLVEKGISWLSQPWLGRVLCLIARLGGFDNFPQMPKCWFECKSYQFPHPRMPICCTKEHDTHFLAEVCSTRKSLAFFGS